MSTKSDNIPIAIGTIVFTVFALSLGDALIKDSSGGWGLWQIFLLRAALVVPVLSVGMAIAGKPLWPRNAGWAVIRSVMLVAMWVSYYAALPHIDLSVAAAIYYTGPLFITLFAFVFAGDKVGPLGWSAVALGFIGVVVILRPSGGDLNFYAFLPLVAAMFYAGAMVLTRTKCRGDHPLTLALSLNVSFLVAGGVGLLFAGQGESFLTAGWAPMTGQDWGLMALMALAILIGSVGAAVAYQMAPPAIIGPFDFAYVGFAVVWSYVFFGDLPDLITCLGLALIVMAGVLSSRDA